MQTPTEARETNGSAENASPNWKATFGYDRYGNRTDYAKFKGTTQRTLVDKTGAGHPSNLQLAASAALRV